MVQINHHEYLTEEEKRLKEDRERTKYWKKWGPYVAERQWATGTATWPSPPPPEMLTVAQSGKITAPTAMPGVVSAPPYRGRWAPGGPL